MDDNQKGFQSHRLDDEKAPTNGTSRNHQPISSSYRLNSSFGKHDQKKGTNVSNYNSTSSSSSTSTSGGFFSGLLRRVVGRPISLVGSSSTLMKQGGESTSQYPSSLQESSNPSSPSLSELSLDSENQSHHDRPSIDSSRMGVNDDQGTPMQLMNRLKNIRSMGITKDYWMKDEKVKECYDCKAVFTTFRRKHHCRICGQIFCHKCASSIVSGERFGYEGEMRVCNFCLRIMEEYSHDDLLNDASTVTSRSGLGLFPLHTHKLRNNPTSGATTNPAALYSPISINRIKSSVQPAYPDSPESTRSNEGFRRMLSSSFFRRPEDSNYAVNTTLDRPVKEDTIHQQPNEVTMQPEFSLHDAEDDEEDSSIFSDSWLPSPFAPSLNALKSEETKPLTNLDRDSVTFPTKLPVFRRRTNNIARRSFSRSVAQTRAAHLQSQLSASLMMQPVLEASTTSAIAREGEVDKDDARIKSSESSPITQELSISYLNHLKRLLRQLLDASDILNSQKWSDCLMPIIQKSCSSLNPDVRNGDQIDIRQFIKIKRISGGSLQESCFVDGVVATKKPLHKRMLRTIENPRILLLTFALDYQRVENQFVSLEPVIAQEREHLKNLLGRILALEPNVILVQRTVSRLALEYLVEANVVVVQSVKPSLMDTIARCTRADTLHSVDKLALNPQLGYCKKFFFKTWSDPGLPFTRKTCMFITGCPADLGCTIILRGDQMDTLSKLKPVVNLMSLLSYSLRLETSLLRDEYCSTPDAIVSDVVEKDPHVQILAKLRDKPFSVDEAIAAFEHTILSGSPSVKFPLPYLLGNMKSQIMKIDPFSSNNYFATDVKKDESAASNPNATTSELHEGKATPEHNGTGDGDIQEGFEQSAPIRILEEAPEGVVAGNVQANYLLSRILSSVSPFTQQSILLLMSSFCMGQIVPCISPQLDLIEYYGESDLTLGQYVEETCLSAGFLCSRKGCDQPLGAHYRNYIHSHGKVTISLDELPCPVQGMEEHIIMWSLCRVCNEATPFVPMSDDAWKFSFGKYLELAFFHTKLSFRALSCPHDIHRDHIRYFSFHNMALRVTFQPIDLYEVSVPAIHFQPSLDVTIRIRQADMDVMRSRITRFYDSCLERIKMFTFDIVPVGRVNNCKEIMQDMSKRLSLEKRFMLQRLQQTFIASAPTDYLALNEVYKELQQQVAVWDNEFAAFVRNNLQSESRDIRRVTAHIRRIFVEKDASGSSLEHRPQSLPPFPATGDNAFETSEAPDSSMLSQQLDHRVDMPKLGCSPPNHSRDVPNPIHSGSELAILKRSMSMKKGRLASLPISLQRKLSVSLMKESKSCTKDNDSIDLDVPSLLPSPSEAAMLFPNLVSWSPGLDEAEIPEEASPASLEPIHPEPSKEKPVSTLEENKPIWTMGDFDDDPDEQLILDDGEYEGMMYPRRLLMAVTSGSSSQRVSNEVVNEETEIPVSTLTEHPPSPEPVNRIIPKDMVYEDEQHGSELNTITGVTAETEQRDENHSGSVMQNGERASIMKTITNLWTGNPANFLPLEYPTSSSEHQFSESLIIVREDEPTSLIAYTLGSKHYEEKLDTLRSTAGSLGLSPTNPIPTHQIDGLARFSKELDDPAGDIDDGAKGNGPHIRYQFWDGTARMHCKVFFAEEFDALRKNCGADTMFVQSLARCIKWDASGGRSGSAFMKTRDDWLVIKQLSRQEVDALYKFAPAYFEYMSQAVFRARPTVLAKLFGFFRIGFKSAATGKTFKMDLLVMENLFYKRQISNIFDLKGSTRNRHVQSTGRQNEVLMDENLLEFTYEKPLFIREHSKKLLRASVHNDTLFLSRLNVMDYSLLVGIDDETHELVVGIVDFIRTFTWDKKLESWVKESGILGGSGKEPTIVTPRQYKNRFREAMERYFQFVPDRFSSISR